MENINLFRHLEDVDDLKLYGRDAILMPGQEEGAKEIASEIFSRLEIKDKKAVFFITSPKIRAKETAELVAKSLRTIDPHLKFRFSVDDDLRAIDQGKFILPDNYKRGESFEGLALASRVFSKETHGADNPGGVDNYKYRFGDPVLMPDGSFKYPQLAGYFSEYGECYQDVLIRLYSLVVKTHEELSRFSGKTELVVITHAQPAHIFKDLIKVGKMIREGEVEYSVGCLARLCWQIYNNPDTGSDEEINSVSFYELENKEMMDILKQEIGYLEKL